jgi:hypothetical protein
MAHSILPLVCAAVNQTSLTTQAPPDTLRNLFGRFMWRVLPARATAGVMCLLLESYGYDVGSYERWASRTLARMAVERCRFIYGRVVPAELFRDAELAVDMRIEGDSHPAWRDWVSIGRRRSSSWPIANTTKP